MAKRSRVRISPSSLGLLDNNINHILGSYLINNLSFYIEMIFLYCITVLITK
jgi:hypothetical protein